MANKNRRRYKKGKTFKKILREKLGVMIIIILLAFGGLCVRLVYITRDNQESYQKKILTQQRYDSTTLPFKRGTITDRNGTILAVSEKVYNVVLDCKVMLDDERSKEPTLSALAECFGLSRSDLDAYVENNPNSQYYVLKKRLTYDEISPFLDKEKEVAAEAAEFNKTADSDNQKGVINGVWFEEEYTRRYPNNSLACDVIGFTGTDNNGTYGLEEYYNDELNGTNGREYGYLNDDATLERTTIAAVDGHSLVSTIDANIQAIAEKYILQFNEEYRDAAREGAGSYNTGCIIMNPNNGEILAMASYPSFDLNNPKDLSAYYTEEEIKEMQDNNTYYDTLNQLWRNFCISDTYEPGSTAKTITIATGLETGKITGNETYQCAGGLQVADHYIRCNVRSGHGTLDVSGALEQSCNVALMEMGEAIGVKTMIKYENIFNLGLKTNIDLAGEARTASLVYNESTMGESELATSSFGQGFNVTMIEMAAAFSSIVNGGYYYEPHVVSKITNSTGDTVRNIEPRVLKQTISETTSAQMRQYLYAAVAEGTGKSARPAGYAIGGKTGTAEKVPRDHKHYVVSFIGCAPADDPQIVIYVVVDEPNAEGQGQAHATFATGIVKNILSEVLPYMHIGMTEEMTIAEQAEVDAMLTNSIQTPSTTTEDGAASGDDTAAGDDTATGDDATTEGNAAAGDDTAQNQDGQDNAGSSTYVVDPNTGELIDPDTGQPAEMDYGIEGDDTSQDTQDSDAAVTNQ